MAFLAGEPSSYFLIEASLNDIFEKAGWLSFFLEMPSTIASLIDSPSSQSSISIPESCSTTLGYPTPASPTEAQLVPKPLTSRKSILHLPKKASKPALVSRPIAALKPSLHYNCTICWRLFAPPCFTIGQSARVVCIECWRYVFSIGVCWACGEIVFRRTDSISFGWCWWHWGCFSCLICSAPLRPPDYLDTSGDAHEQGVLLHEPPVCERCSTSSSSLPQLEQHAKVLGLHNSNLPQAVDGSCSRVSLFDPLNPAKKFVQRDKLKPFPKWMELLPSNRKPQPAPVQRHSFLRKMSLPSMSRSTSGSDKSFTTSPEYRSEVDFTDEFEALASSPLARNRFTNFKNRVTSTPAASVRKTKSVAFPRYGKEMARIIEVPSISSSKGDSLKNYLKNSQKSREYLEKYHPGIPPDPPAFSTTKPRKCPICEEFVDSPDAVERSDTCTYHHRCFVCCICGQNYNASDEKIEDYKFLNNLPYHKRCLGAKAKPLVERMRKSRSSQQDPPQRSRSPAAKVQSRKESRISPKSPPTTPIAAPKRKASFSTSATGILGARPALINELSSFFASRRKKSLPAFDPALPSTGSICAACDKAILALEKVEGPNETVLHRTCLVCKGCQKGLREGSRWYEWGRAGLMEPSCKACWRQKRRERGMSEERIDSEERGLLGLAEGSRG